MCPQVDIGRGGPGDLLPQAHGCSFEGCVAQHGLVVRRLGRKPELEAPQRRWRKRVVLVLAGAARRELALKKKSLPFLLIRCLHRFQMDRAGVVILKPILYS